MGLGQRVTILYEDQRGPSKGFGLHRFGVACVFDEVDGERHKVEKLLEDFRPLKGNSKLLRAVQEDIGGISFDGRPVVAVFDDDKARKLLQIPMEATDEEVVEELRSRCPREDVIAIILLKRNIETVIKQIRQAGLSVGEDLLRRALDKELIARDAVFSMASKDINRGVRRRVIESNESLRELVKRLSCWTRMALGRNACSQA